MTEASYTAWDGNLYEWPPPDGWYQAADGKWWPEGYGPSAERGADGSESHANGASSSIGTEHGADSGNGVSQGDGSFGESDDGLPSIDDLLPNIDDVFGGAEDDQRDDDDREARLRDLAAEEVPPLDDILPDLDDADGSDHVAGGHHDASGREDAMGEHQSPPSAAPTDRRGESELSVDRDGVSVDRDDDHPTPPADSDTLMLPITRVGLDADEPDSPSGSVGSGLADHGASFEHEPVFGSDDVGLSSSAFEQLGDLDDGLHRPDEPEASDPSFNDSGFGITGFGDPHSGSVDVDRPDVGGGRPHADEAAVSRSGPVGFGDGAPPVADHYDRHANSALGDGIDYPEDDDHFGPSYQGTPEVRSVWPLALIGVCIAILLILLLAYLLLRGGGDEETGAVASGPGDSYAEAWDLGRPVRLFYEQSGRRANWYVEVIEPVQNGTGLLAQPVEAINDDEILAVTRVRVTYAEDPDPAREILPTGQLAEVSLSAVSAGEVRYESGGCGELSDPLVLDGGLNPAESVEGNLCWRIAADDLNGLQMLAEVRGVGGSIYMQLD